jgi:DNA helicase II / ATP-dependent DNA helicase PcrA
MAEKLKEKVDVTAAPTVRFAALYRQLNDRQRTAVDAIDGPVMVLAGPGTGKTQVLAMRAANILRQTQMDPWNILCLTFTESAAAAMRRRLLGIVGETAYQVRLSTFHSFCNDIIQEHPDRFAQSTQWQVLSDLERVTLIRELLDTLPAASPLKPFGHPYVYLSDIVQNIRWLKKEGVTEERFKELLDKSQRFTVAADGALADFFALSHTERTDADCDTVQEALAEIAREAETTDTVWPELTAIFDRWRKVVAKAGKREAGRGRTRLKNELKQLHERWRRQLPRQGELLTVYRRYQKKLSELGRYDYEDMIMQVLERLRTDDELLASYQEQYQYILVDEYQDTNGAQNEVVKLLGSFYPNPNIFVVGDDKQSIFRFQGASLENLVSFYRQYERDVTLVSLTDNYRSQQTVLDAAGAVIAHNTATVANVLPGVQSSLAATAGKPEHLESRAFDSEDEEDYFVATKIQQLISAGVEPSEIAVLYRFNRDALGLLDVLLRLGVPVQVSAGENVLRDKRVRQLLSMLHYVADEQREEVLAEIVQYDCFGLDPLATLKAIRFAGRGRLSLLTVLSDSDRLAEAGVAEAAPLADVARRLAAWRRAAANDTLPGLFDTVLQESGLLREILADQEQLSALHHVTTVFNELRRLSQAEPQLSIRDFIDRLRLLEEHGLSLTAESWQTKSSAVQLMTAHRAKGLEFAHVFLTRLVDRHWGNLRARGRLVLPPGVVRYDPVAGQENNEDERRLFYVALTRAKQRVHLSYAERNSEGRPQVPSLFRREIPAQYVRQIETRETEDEALERLSVLRLSPPQTTVQNDVREWLAEQLQAYVMSVTHLNNYLACPRLFYHRNLLRVPERKNKHMALGTAVHNALRDVFVRRREDTNAGAGFLGQRFRYYLGREDLTPAERADSLALGETSLSAYWEHWRGSFVAAVLAEYSFSSHGVHLDDLRLTGKLDKIEVINEKKKEVNVVDYKTGNPDNARGRLKEGGDYRRQLVFYQLLCDLSPRFPYTMVSGELDFIQPSTRTGKFVKKSFTISAGEIEELTATIRRVWREIKALKFLEPDAACGECKYCRMI